MIERANQKAHNLSLEKGDYVYLGKDPRGAGQKFKLKHAGPYIIHRINSPHLYSLMEPKTNKVIPQPVHINRLKPAYIRVPNPCEYFMDRVISKQDTMDTASTSHDNLISEQSSTNNDEVLEVPNLRRSTRQRQKPIRFRDDNFITSGTETSSASDGTLLK
ncbi:unnamed protein product [Mytilus coruscus]|uniref:Integrase zinc-binding domain-containing protein n=1 Tax=Mytilus coruscus TaxID=42192 RepID=A0A6J8CGV1_MYTCO|nr:unnamed protein product [Mytilus coruscus]